MKTFKVTTLSLPDKDARKEYVIRADNKESAKITLDRVLGKQSADVSNGSKSQILAMEEVGYFYGHKLEPHKISDLIDNLEIYIAEMRETEDMESIPKYLKQYAWEYFREVELTKEDLQGMALFIVDRMYRVISNIELMDNYTRAYFAKVIPFLWDSLQNRGVDTFYILDNELREDRFRAVVELFQLTGIAVVTPYGEHEYLKYDSVEKQIRDYMAPVRNIMYIEKDANVNYLDKVLKLAKESKYLCVFRNKAPDDPKVEVSNSQMSRSD